RAAPSGDSRRSAEEAQPHAARRRRRPREDRDLRRQQRASLQVREAPGARHRSDRGAEVGVRGARRTAQQSSLWIRDARPRLRFGGGAYAVCMEVALMPRAYATVLIGCLILAVAGVAGAAETDWKAVEQALGKTGQLQAGDVFRVGMPRTDLAVTVKGVRVRPGFALGSYAAFAQVGDRAMVMGDLVLLDQEVPAVMSGLLNGGLEVTAVHNHLNEMSPHVMYMHYAGHGDAVQMAKALRQALSASATPLGTGGAPPAAASQGPGLDTKQIEQALGRQGRDVGAGVFQVTAPRAESIT